MTSPKAILRILVALWLQVCCCQVNAVLATPSCCGASDSCCEADEDCCGSDSDCCSDESEPCCPSEDAPKGGCGCCCQKAPPPSHTLDIPTDTIGLAVAGFPPLAVLALPDHGSVPQAHFGLPPPIPDRGSRLASFGILLI